jgi:hypothetical protein
MVSSSESLTVADADRHGDRPASAVAAIPDNAEDLSDLLSSQYLGFGLFGGWRLHECGDVATDPATAHRDT